ncbi:GIY-YIG nuclease family protein [Natranaerobius thermophilus]|uniref:Putative orphan protein n=1 Tax=Natranaerobius thermophilus (strain ATCC BAA-1301 / DSM 18059 / JW/NM-WN-LF) TaxID=457570 RepID=B2A3Z2_NATTJ|nr:GIY-YIG nuclease family protein [Natranaerobius thermophilus]ACB85094.1 putative orphan protein [Natranaerobius thermophilus JW/NM-WN-LF]
MKTERKDVQFPLWRKKVDSSLFNDKGTTIPKWVCNMWNIQNEYYDCTSKKHEKAQVSVYFENIYYEGQVTVASKGRKTPAYRLWFSDELLYRLKDVYLMSYMRDIEIRLREEKDNIEEEIPFWEFLDIEYDEDNKIFYFVSHYTQKPSFPELFRRMIESPTLHKIDDELRDKTDFRIYKQNWKPRKDIETEIGAENIIYFLIDTTNKLLYIGEAKDLVKRLKFGKHKEIPYWNYYRYNVLPDEISSDNQRRAIERMIIRDYAALLSNKKGVDNILISDYKLANIKIDF